MVSLILSILIHNCCCCCCFVVFVVFVSHITIICRFLFLLLCIDDSILTELNKSVTQVERWNALQNILHTFTHDNTELHNYEIVLGADKALCLKLGYAVVTLQKDGGRVSKEVTIICQSLLQIYKSSIEYRTDSFRHVGATELIPLLIQIWTNLNEMKHTSNMNQCMENCDDAILQIIRVLRVFSKLIPAKSLLIKYLQNQLLGQVLQQVVVWIKQPSVSSFYSTTEIYWESLGLIKDLTFRSQSLDKEILLTIEHGIIQKILCHCCTITESLHPKLQEWFTAVVWNLVLDPVCCEKLISNTGKENQQWNVVKGLLRILIHQSANPKPNGLSVKTKRNAISAIGNIVADPKSQYFLFGNETFVRALALVPRLMNLVQHDKDSVVRRRAMRTIRCLVSSSNITIKRLVENESMPKFLTDVIGQNLAHDDENDYDMQIQACQGAISLTESFLPEHCCHLLLSLVKRIETTKSSKVISVASQCLAECIKRTTWMKHPKNLSDLFWKRIETAASISSETHESISSLFLELRLEEGNAENAGLKLASIPSILTNTAAVNTLTSIISEIDPNQEKSRTTALDIVVRLMENEINKKPLAENERLLSGLVNLCLMEPQHTNKVSAKKIILDLVPEI